MRLPATLGKAAASVVESKAPGVGVHDASPVLGTGWNALSFHPGGAAPPDVQMAVGPNHVVEVVNINLSVYSKQGVSLATYNLSDFFTTGFDYLGDPRIEYDGLSDRWFVTLGDFSTGQVLVAASKSPNPIGGWSTYRVPSSASSECMDQPILGVGTLNVIVSVNVYSNCFSTTYTYNGAQLWVMNKTDLVTGVPGPWVWTSPRYPTDFSIHPVHMYGRNPTQYMVATRWDVSSDTSTVLQLFAVNGSPPGTVVVSETDHAMAMAALPPPAAQLGTFSALDTTDFRIADAIWSRGVLWLAFNEVCNGFSPMACVRLIEFDANVPAIRQDFRLSSQTRHYFFPALALDGAGNLAVLVGYASGSDHPGLLATGRLTGDPPGVLQPPVLMKAGAGVEQTWCDSTFSVCRYGDYFGASADPSDPTQVWLAGQFGRGTMQGWGTYISPVRMKAMLTLNYSVDSGAVPTTGPTLHIVRGGTRGSAVIGADPTTFLADPGTTWQIDASFTTASGQARYLSRASDAANLSGVANRSVSTSLVYQVQYPLTIDVSPGGTVDYSVNSTRGAVSPGAKEAVYVFAGSVVNLTAHPTSMLWVFAGWTGNLTGSAPSGSIAVAHPRSVAARFVLNWAFIAAISTVAVIAAVALTVFLRRRKRRNSPRPTPPVPPPLPPSPPASPPASPPPLGPPPP